MSRVTRGPKETKATKSETEASQQRVEQSGSSGSVEQNKASPNPTFEHFEVDYYLTDNTATVHPNT